MNITKDSVGSVPVSQCFEWCKAQQFYSEFDGLTLFSAAFASLAGSYILEFMNERAISSFGSEKDIKTRILICNFLRLFSFLLFAVFYAWVILKYQMGVTWLG